MESISQLFSYLNDVNLIYVVLRNWDGLPHKVELGQHSDLDLLVYDLDHFLEVIDECEPEHDLPRVRYKVPIGDNFIYVDARHIGDGYYPTDFQQSILETRELNKNGFYTPNPIHHRIALCYHSVHHKAAIAKEYTAHLGDATLDELLQALKESNIGWAKPSDPTVGSYNPYWKGATSVVSKKNGMVVKKQVSFNNYNLLENEYTLLKELNKDCFPQALGIENGELRLEDCGEPLLYNNLPKDWKKQLTGILKALKEASVLHRDIKPDNLMVKDGIIKLIDLGWAVGAKNDSSYISHSPPSCLGFPYRPSTGFSDQFSMNKVIKEYEYKLDEHLERTI